MNTPNRLRAATDQARESLSLPKAWGPILLVPVIVGAALSGCGEQSEAGGNKSSSSGQSPQQRIEDALGSEVSSGFAVGDSEVRSVETAGSSLPVIVTLTTPAGGFDGPSTDDTDALASSAFAEVYEDTGWQGSARVVFRGGLVDAATGQEMPDAPTASYSVAQGDAKQIEWADDEALYNIDWSIYRGFCHPALKGCE